ncbi:hypothetical protein Tco_0834448 [Tanacetum coccineum]
MATMAKNVIAAGSETRPPMLEKGMYDSWKTQIILYIQGKENGEMLKDSIDNCPYQFKSEITVKDTYGVTEIHRPQRLKDLAGEDKLRYDGHIAKQCTVKKKVKDSEWFKDKMLLAQAQEAGVVLNEEQQDFFVDSLEETDDTTTNAIFMANLFPVGSLNDDTVKPRYDSDIHFEVPYYDTYYDSDMLNSNIQELGYIEYIVYNNESYDELKGNNDVISYIDYILTIRNDEDNYVPPPIQIKDMMLSVIEQMKSQDLNNHIAFLNKNFETLKKESSERYEKNISEIVDLENAKKELEIIVFKVSQSAQTMHMLTKPQNFYDETHKTALGYQNPLYLSQARRLQTALYNGNVLIVKHNPVSVSDSGETLILAEESRLKMLEKQIIELLEEARALQPLDEHISYASKFAERIQELLVYVNASRPFTQSRNEKLAPTTCPRKNNKPYVDTSRTKQIIETITQKHAVKQNTRKTDNTILPSTGRVSYTNASGSKPRSNTKNDRILQTSSRSRKNKVEAHHRKFKSSANKNNHVSDCNANIKNVALSKNSDTICLFCNECMFSVNHDACVVQYLKKMQKHKVAKSAKQKVKSK